MAENTDDTFQHYIAYRYKLHEIYGGAWESLSKNILYLSSGALVLSLTFAGAVKISHLEGVVWIKASWIAFTLVIALSLIASCTTIIASYNTIKKWDESYDKQESFSGCSCMNIITGILMGLIVLIFMLGIMTFLCFAFSNVGGLNGEA